MSDKRYGCEWCFETLTPNDGDETLRQFVSCRGCEALYHLKCRKRLNTCCRCGNKLTRDKSISIPPAICQIKRAPREDAGGLSRAAWMSIGLFFSFVLLFSFWSSTHQRKEDPPKPNPIPVTPRDEKKVVSTSEDDVSDSKETSENRIRNLEKSQSTDTTALDQEIARLTRNIIGLRMPRALEHYADRVNPYYTHGELPKSDSGQQDKNGHSVERWLYFHESRWPTQNYSIIGNPKVWRASSDQLKSEITYTFHYVSDKEETRGTSKNMYTWQLQSDGVPLIIGEHNARWRWAVAKGTQYLFTKQNTYETVFKLPKDSLIAILESPNKKRREAYATKDEQQWTKGFVDSDNLEIDKKIRCDISDFLLPWEAPPECRTNSSAEKFIKYYYKEIYSKKQAVQSRRYQSEDRRRRYSLGKVYAGMTKYESVEVDNILVFGTSEKIIADVQLKYHFNNEQQVIGDHEFELIQASGIWQFD